MLKQISTEPVQSPTPPTPSTPPTPPTPILITRNETESDKEWTNCAIRNRHDVILYTYNNLNNQVFMKTLKGGSTTMQVILHDQGYKNYLMKACNDIGVDYPNDKDSSFKRDYYLIRDAESIYFTGYFDTKSKSRLQIKGREAWLVEMFVNKIQETRKLANQNQKEKIHNCMVSVYMFSEDLNCWCQLNISTSKWIYILRAPKPNGKYLAFGTHPISNTARIELSLI
jgi:hypothetical protein